MLCALGHIFDTTTSITIVVTPPATNYWQYAHHTWFAAALWKSGAARDGGRGEGQGRQVRNGIDSSAARGVAAQSYENLPPGNQLATAAPTRRGPRDGAEADGGVRLCLFSVYPFCAHTAGFLMVIRSCATRSRAQSRSSGSQDEDGCDHEIYCPNDERFVNALNVVTSSVNLDFVVSGRKLLPKEECSANQMARTTNPMARTTWRPPRDGLGGSEQWSILQSKRAERSRMILDSNEEIGDSQMLVDTEIKHSMPSSLRPKKKRFAYFYSSQSSSCPPSFQPTNNN